jgi:hypothetical protein
MNAAGVGHESVQLTVRAAGKKEMFDCDMTGKTLDDLKWEKKAWDLFGLSSNALFTKHRGIGTILNDD